MSVVDDSDDEGERPTRKRRLAERAAEGGIISQAEEEEVSPSNFIHFN